MSLNSTEAAAAISALVNDFWQTELVPLAAQLREQGVSPLGSAEPRSTWQPPLGTEFAFSVARPTPEVLAMVWKDEPALLALVQPVSELAERLGALEPEPDAMLSPQLYVMF